MTIRDLLLVRRGLAFVETSGERLADDLVRAVDLELAALGYVASERLRSRLATASIEELTAFRSAAIDALLAAAGGNVRHEPLFRSFPDGIPTDTRELWWRKVIVHFLQDDTQPCLFCRQSGTTHVLMPCAHVVCDRCFDGASYSACPVCEHHVDRSSPFFRPLPERPIAAERIRFKLLDLGTNFEESAREYFESLCARPQALSPADREALEILVRESSTAVLSWIPDRIPLRENVAVVFGTLFLVTDPAAVLPAARRFMTTATDVLRFLAVLSGADGSLERQTRLKRIDHSDQTNPLWKWVAKNLGVQVPDFVHGYRYVPIRTYRFKMAKLPRPLRRALLELLDGFDADRLVEDMLRHRSSWVWAGEFLHPHEYAGRYPNVARAFQIVRGKAPDGTPAPRFETWASRLERAASSGDSSAMLSVLDERPGEFARRLDHVLRVAGADPAALDSIVSRFTERVPALATPVLLTLAAHLPARELRAGVRVYWPKGRVAKGVSGADTRVTLTRRASEPAVRAIDAELLERFARKDRFRDGLIDEALASVAVPFNERTASTAAVALPRGSRVQVPSGKVVRLFLHWCEPEKAAYGTDLDLSIALYDDNWQFLGTCSYYELTLMLDEGGPVVARSAGDLRDAPWPEGATEFVDLHRDEAVAGGARYAVMVVNAYAGMPFSMLERGFAGLMLRDDASGQHFDPRTVELRFRLDGENGVFLPLVLDVRASILHWLDVQSKGQFEMNNVENSKSAIAKLCPELMEYFGSGCRPSMLGLALRHAAARCDNVTMRGRDCSGEEHFRIFRRASGESHQEFFVRLKSGEADEVAESLVTVKREWAEAVGRPLFAALVRGDVDLPEASVVYALFRDRSLPTIAASDLLS